MLSDTINWHDIDITICVNWKTEQVFSCVQQFVFFTYRVEGIGNFLLF